MTDLLAAVITLEARAAGELDAFQGRALHALFLDLTRPADPPRAQALHDSDELKPFTSSNLSGLHGLSGDAGNRAAVQPGQSFRWRVTACGPGLAGLWLGRVLPDLLHIEAAGVRGGPPLAGFLRPQAGAQTPVRQPDRTPAPTTPAAPPALAPVKRAVTLSQPKSAAEVEPGMYLEGRVVRTEPARVVVDVCGEEATLLREAISPPVRNDADLRERFPKDKVIRVWVTSRNKAGRLQLKMLRS